MMFVGLHEFSSVFYSRIDDVLYLSKVPGEVATQTIASPEGHAVRLDRSGALLGLTLISPAWLLEQHQAVRLTLVERVELHREDLARAVD